MAFDPFDLFKTATNGLVFDPDKYNADQTAIENYLNNLLEGVDPGDSGAHNISCAPIVGLNTLGSTKIWGFLNAMKDYIDDLIAGVTLGAIARWSLRDDQHNPDELITIVDVASLDATSGAYTHTQYKRKLDDTLYLDSVLTVPDANHYYQTLTLNYYDTDGVTIIKTVTKAITYNADGLPLTIT